MSYEKFICSSKNILRRKICDSKNIICVSQEFFPYLIEN